MSLNYTARSTCYKGWTTLWILLLPGKSGSELPLTINHNIWSRHFEKIIMGAYRWLADNYKEGDRIFLFGFSRGAYQVRALAGMIHTVGLIHKGNEEQIPFAYELYANHTPLTAATATVPPPINLPQRFKTTFSRDNVHVHFVGVWDTVSSVGIVRGKSLPLTNSAEHICFFRHALALDERRVKFLPEYVNGGSATTGNTTVVQNGRPRIKEVWFPGTHSDMWLRISFTSCSNANTGTVSGGGNRDNLDLDLGGTPFLWMSFEAVSSGLRLQSPRVEWPWDKLHEVQESLTYTWWICEWFPIKRLSYEGPDSTTNLWHRGQGRKILSGQKLHSSIAFCPQGYNPKAALPQRPQRRRWVEIVAAGQRFDQDWAVEWKDILEMDIFDHAIMPEIVNKLKLEPEGDNTVWTYRLDIITSTNQGREALLGVPNVMRDLVQILEYAVPETRKCVTKVLEDLEMFLYGESSEIQADDLEEAISYHREALTCRLDTHPGRCSSLNSLAMYLQARFNKLSSKDDLDEAIGCYREVLHLRPSDHPDYCMSLTNLANALFARYDYSRVMNDLNEAVVCYTEAADSRPLGHPGRYNNLAKALQARFNRLGDLGDLQEAIEYDYKALDLRPPKHPGRSHALSKLANALLARYEQTSMMGDLDEAIERSREVLELRPPGNLDRSSALNNLATAILARYEQLGREKDLTDAITFYRDALALQTEGPSYRPFPLSNLASALLALYQHSGDMKDLEEAIKLHNDSLYLYSSDHPGYTLYSSDHPGYSHSLNNHANGLYLGYLHSGNLVDLNQAIKNYLEVLALCPRGQLDRPSCLNNLANALLTRHKQSNSEEDLNDAIEHHREALDICRPGHVGRSNCLQSLAISLIARFDLSDKMVDLEEAISHLREALILRPLHPGRFTSLDDLATAIFTRFNKLHEMDDPDEMGDLDEAIEFHREALALRPPGHRARFEPLQKLAFAIVERYQRLRNEDDLNEAILYVREAIELCPPDDTDLHELLIEVDAGLTGDLEQSDHDLDEELPVIEQQIDPLQASQTLDLQQ
ncbi:uncharacterized protein LACBIDRAFT_294115 [Laccaria bicolor S238N-H82]|uniref:Predicted protein n=1 Tax=Laccaria bicolor (strain S238N-H82 / ATCC MYA-4686) TaxID=486041 RepID=B0D9H1_LACBS|nr:uncharacterized protein LACBIDRAFT_294115 [Laccaria bicolor S238N-H82]EDR08351.1 predicted protein [Laccaria bicolor S238N-H82]|eukprot:XP_001880576.1 predicted protein [Laccaria bicolor S238N-H82]